MSVTVSEPGMDSDALRSVDHHREAAPDSSPEAASAPVACPGMHKDGRTQVRPKLWLDGALLVCRVVARTASASSPKAR